MLPCERKHGLSNNPHACADVVLHGRGCGDRHRIRPAPDGPHIEPPSKRRLASETLLGPGPDGGASHGPHGNVTGRSPKPAVYLTPQFQRQNILPGEPYFGLSRNYLAREAGARGPAQGWVPLSPGLSGEACPASKRGLVFTAVTVVTTVPHGITVRSFSTVAAGAGGELCRGLTSQGSTKLNCGEEGGRAPASGRGDSPAHRRDRRRLQSLSLGTRTSLESTGPAA